MNAIVSNYGRKGHKMDVTDKVLLKRWQVSQDAIAFNELVRKQR